MEKFDKIKYMRRPCKIIVEGKKRNKEQDREGKKERNKKISNHTATETKREKDTYFSNW